MTKEEDDRNRAMDDEIEGPVLFIAARDGDLDRVMKWFAEEGDGRGGLITARQFEWDWNPIRALIEGSGRWKKADLLLRRIKQGPDLLQARCPSSGKTLLHLAVECRKEKLAVLLVRSLAAHVAPDRRQRFLEAVNGVGQTALHIATQNLLTLVVAELTLEKQLKINIKDSNGKTAFDVIRKRCHECTLKGDWKTPWRISIMLRGVGAKFASELELYEDEEDTVKELTAIESLVMNDKSWNTNIQTILLVATLAITLVFAAILTIPQTLALGGGGGSGGGGSGGGDIQANQSVIYTLQGTLSNNKSFRPFIGFLTVACVLMFCVIANILLTITYHKETRALILCFSLGSISIMGFSLFGVYIITVFMYTGTLFTVILTTCAITVIAFNIFLAFYFDPCKAMKETISTILSMTLLHGFFITLCLSILPNRFHRLISSSG